MTLKFAIGVTIAAALLSACTGGSSVTPEQRTPAAAPVILKISAVDLADSYADNEIAATRRFGNATTVRTWGTVVYIEKDGDSAVLSLAADNAMAPRAHLDSPEMDAVALLRVGDTVHLQCASFHFDVVLNLNDCIIRPRRSSAR